MNRRILIEYEGLPDAVPLQRNCLRGEVLLLPQGHILARYDNSGLQVVGILNIENELNVNTSHLKSDEGRVAKTDHLAHNFAPVWLDYSHFPTLASLHEDGTLQIYEIEGEVKSQKIADPTFSTVTSEAHAAIVGKNGANILVITSTSLKVYLRQGRKISVVNEMNVKKMVPEEIQPKLCCYNGALCLISSNRVAQVWSLGPEIPVFEAKLTELRAPNGNSFLFNFWVENRLLLFSSTHIISVNTEYLTQQLQTRLKAKGSMHMQYNTLVHSASIEGSARESKKELLLPNKISFAWCDEEYVITVDEGTGLITLRDFKTLEVLRILNIPSANAGEVKKVAIRKEEFNTILFVLKETSVSVYDMEAKSSKPIRIYESRDPLRDFILDGPINLFAVAESAYPVTTIYLWRFSLKPRSAKSNTIHFTHKALFKRFYSVETPEIKERFISVGAEDQSEGIEPPYEVEDCTHHVTMGVDLFNYPLFHNQIRFPTSIFFLLHEIYHKGIYQRNLFQQNWGDAIMQVVSMINESRIADIKQTDAGLLAEGLKLWLQSFQEPLFTFNLYPKLIAAADAPIEKRAEKADEVVKELPATNRILFQLLIVTLDHIVQHKDLTNVTASALGLTFGPCLVGGFGAKNNANFHTPKLAILGRVFLENLAKALVVQHANEGLTGKELPPSHPANRPGPKFADSKAFMRSSSMELRGGVIPEQPASRSKDSSKKQLDTTDNTKSRPKVSPEDSTVVSQPEPSVDSSLSAEKRNQLVVLISELCELFKLKLDYIVKNLDHMNNAYLAEMLTENVYQLQLLVVENQQTSDWQPDPNLYSRVRKHIAEEASARQPNLNEINILKDSRQKVSGYISLISPKLEQLSSSIQEAKEAELVEAAMLTQRMKRILL